MGRQLVEERLAGRRLEARLATPLNRGAYGARGRKQPQTNSQG